MKILHYTLGYPPSRTGGLVGYAIDLMEQQISMGHQVISLHPGEINIFTKRTYIIKSKKEEKILKYKIINSLPLALFGGIATPEDFMTKVDPSIYYEFFNTIKPDIIHIHSLLGVHKEFFEVAKKLNIQIVFTSHDYFGLAPEPNFFLKERSYDRESTAENWYLASRGALGTKKLRMFQTRIYPLIRKLKKIITKVNKQNLQKEEIDSFDKKKVNKYQELKEYYKSIFYCVDMFHFNSTLAKEVFRFNLRQEIPHKVISITNNQIKLRKITKDTRGSKLRVAYIGPDKKYKGYFDFLRLTQIYPENDVEFHTFGYEPTKNNDNQLVIEHGRYNSSNIDTVFNSFDILVVPSLWKETFGLIVVEALSYNKIVFVSTNVGSKELVPSEWVFEDIEELEVKLKKIVDNKIEYLDQTEMVKTMKEHAYEIEGLYTDIIMKR
ncbi:glycosyltransferase [Candidatus Enterococcus willemsii]|uniref:Glycosyl transferase family 1 domain-containing protein n=1 Tax=Candidatus Enterococcus willemsii TaxID=1857215 RepID=A0ABQ6YZ41_9ENTE|nr:glycosyltransferase [Enterococcus sp. CU12B]KAF1303637.1 hypothetical protein BAU17_06525 [Enterococcus sp. CU12B]